MPSDDTLPNPGQPAGWTGFQTKLETIHGSGADMLLRSLLDRNQYHDPEGAADRAGIPESAWSLFGLLWPSARVMAHAMLAFELGGKRILEVGCGLGLASLVIHRRGGNITASDGHPLAGIFLAENARINLLPVIRYQAGSWAQANPALGLFDVIIGSDVLYDRGQPELLSRFIDRHSGAEVEVLIVDPSRGNQAPFTRHMTGLGYSHAQSRVTSLPDGSAYKGHMHRYCRGPLMDLKH